MSARPQADWRELEPLYAPELRAEGEGPLACTSKGIVIGSAWTPPLSHQMSDEAIKVQGWLLRPSKSLEPLRVRVWDWCLYAIAVGVMLALAMRWI